MEIPTGIPMGMDMGIPWRKSHRFEIQFPCQPCLIVSVIQYSVFAVSGEKKSIAVKRAKAEKSRYQSDLNLETKIC